MTNGNAVISGIRNAQNQHELIIGSYIEQKGGGGMMMSGGGMMGAVAGMYMGPGGGYTRTTRFQTLFDPITAKHIDGIVEPTGAELANKYAEDKSIPADGSDTFTINQSFYYTYYSRDELKLVVVKLK